MSMSMIATTRRPGVQDPSLRWKQKPARGLPRDSEIEIKRGRRRERREQREVRLTDDQRDLAERYLALARSIAKPLKEIFHLWRHEFESAACMALVEAARTFDPSRGLKFATFARFRIRGALADVGRAMRLPEGLDEDRPGIVALTPYLEEHGEVLVASEPPPVGAEFDDVDAVEGLLRKLPRKHAEVCRLHYLHGKTQAEIAGQLGISQSEVTRRHKLALEMLWEPTDPDGKPNARGGPARRGRRKTTNAGVIACSC
jgi:RNA polymerase sigma factor (sigma-70 family)